jgi:hypothetical protein
MVVYLHTWCYHVTEGPDTETYDFFSKIKQQEIRKALISKNGKSEELTTLQQQLQVRCYSLCSTIRYIAISVFRIFVLHSSLQDKRQQLL